MKKKCPRHKKRKQFEEAHEDLMELYRYRKTNI